MNERIQEATKFRTLKQNIENKYTNKDAVSDKCVVDGSLENVYESRDVSHEDDLEVTMKKIMETSEKQKTVENQHQDALNRLKNKQEELEKLRLSNVEGKHNEYIKALEERIKELEKNSKIQTIQQEELLSDLKSIKLKNTQKAETLKEESKETNPFTSPPSSLESSQQTATKLEHKAENHVTTAISTIQETIASPLPALPKASSMNFPLVPKNSVEESISIYVAKFDYDPKSMSPNDHWECELDFKAGDFLFLRGNVVEEQYYEAEKIIDASKGLVPSNYIEKVPDCIISEYLSIYNDPNFSMNKVSFRDSGHSDSTSAMPPLPKGESIEDTETLSIDEASLPSLLPSDFESPQSDILLPDSQLSRLTLETLHQPLIYPPTNLKVERQFLKSLLISWSPPLSMSESIQSYHVLLNGCLRCVIKKNERTKALIEDIDVKKTHRICVRAVTNVGFSHDASCTLLIGREVSFSPTFLTASQITDNFAFISWLPSNSNFIHAIHVNNIEIVALNPGIFRYKMTGLTPSTIYSVAVKVKNSPHEKMMNTISAPIEFKTLPGKIPEPPTNIIAEPGPQEGTLLLSWKPLPIDNANMFNGSHITGYAVYIDGRKISNLVLPKCDHIVLNMKNSSASHTSITLRTLSNESESRDSLPAKFLTRGEIGAVESYPIYAKQTPSVLQDSESPYNLFHPSARTEEVSGHLPQAIGKSSQITKQKYVQPTVQTYPGYISPTVQQASTINISSYLPNVNQGIGSEPTYPMYNTLKEVNRFSPVNQMSPKRQTLHHSDYNDVNKYPSFYTNIPSQSLTTQKNYFVDPPMERDQYFQQIPMLQSRNPNQAIPRERRSNRSHIHNPHQRSSSSVHREKGSRDKSEAYSRLQQAPNSTNASQHLNENYVDHHDSYTSQHPLLIALYNYDPKTMSPNPDAESIELPFREGQIIKKLKEKDEDGFYKGECNGKVGLVPCNMVKEYTNTPESEIYRKLPINQNFQQVEQEDAVGQCKGASLTTKDALKRGIKKMVALYNYDPYECSPNVDAESELAFKAGDVITIIKNIDKDGFYVGELNGKTGYVPSNFLEEENTYYNNNLKREDKFGEMAKHKDKVMPHDVEDKKPKHKNLGTHYSPASTKKNNLNTEKNFNVSHQTPQSSQEESGIMSMLRKFSTR